MPPPRMHMVTRASKRRGEAAGLSDAASSLPTRSGSCRGHNKRPQAALDSLPVPGLLPMLDDAVAGDILSYLPCSDLGVSNLISKAWLASNENESLWRPFLSTVDPIATLGPAKLSELADQFTCRQVVTQLSLRLCSLCREPTSGFFTLTCSRVCESCFETDAGVTMCSLSFAKAHFLLSNSQAARIPTLRVDDARETGLVDHHKSITLTTCSASKASAIARWGSEEAFQAEMSARKVKAEAAHQARVAAYEASQQQSMAKSSSFSREEVGEADSTSTSPSAESSPLEKPKRYPSTPRLCRLSRETNYVASNQQEGHGVRGEKYGFYWIVNDAFFDAGPTITISCATSSRNPRGPDTTTTTSNNDDLVEEVCGAACNGCSSDSYARFHTVTESYNPWDDQGYGRTSRGREFVEALKTAKDGTTINISSRITVNDNVYISGAVRIVGTSRGRLELGFGAMFLREPCILRGLSLSRMAQILDGAFMDQHGYCSEDEGPMPEGPAVFAGADTLMHNCTFGACPLGAGVELKAGRLVARGNTFQDSTAGLVVDPLPENSHGRKTTVHVESNHFLGCDSWGIEKGPARHHLQDNGTVERTNTFSDNNDGAIRDFYGD